VGQYKENHNLFSTHMGRGDNVLQYQKQPTTN